MTNKLRLIFALIVCSALLGANLRAQSAWLPPAGRSSISVEIYRLDRPSRNANGTAMFIAARIRKPSGLTFVLDVPVARSDEIPRFGQMVSFTQSSQTAIGNPYFGISYRGNEETSVTFDVGIRMPVTQEDKGFARDIGIKTDFDRWEAFVPDQVSFRALVGGFWSKQGSPHTGWIKGGGTLLISSEGNGLELLIDLQSGVWYMGDVVVYGFNLNGRALLTERRLSLSERYEFLFGFGFMVNLGSFRPGLHGRYQISESRLFSSGQNQNATFGFSLNMFLGGNDDE